MTDQEPQRSRTAGCARAAAILVVATGGLLLLGWFALALLFANAFRECMAPQWIEGSAPLSTATLDATHPVAEQTVTVRIPAQALPDDVPAGGVLLKVDPELAPASASPSPAARASGPPDAEAATLDVAFIALDPPGAPGRIVPAIDKPALTELPNSRSAVLDCPRGQACERTYRVVVTLRNAPAAPLAVQWQADLIVRADSFGGCPDRVPPRPDVQATNPLVGAGMASAELAPTAGSGTIVATHVRVGTDSAGEAAWARIVLSPDPAVEPDRWLPWVRVTDDAGRVLADGPAGQHWSPTQQTLIEVPVLSRCAPGAACSDGLWVVVQAIPSDVPPFQPTWRQMKASASFSWTASVTSVGDGSGLGTPRMQSDQTAPDPGPAPAVEAAGPTVLLSDGVTRAVEAKISVPAQSTQGDTGDWRRGAVAVVGWYGHGITVTAALEGAGAAPIAGYASGDGMANLVAHPFDACPAAGPCEATVTLVSKFTADPHSSVGGDVKSVWDVSLLGVPPGTTVTFGPPVDRPSPGSQWLPLPALAVASGAVLAGVLVIWRRRLRRGATVAGDAGGR